jgi:hypothetical protein
MQVAVIQHFLVIIQRDDAANTASLCQVEANVVCGNKNCGWQSEACRERKSPVKTIRSYRTLRF